MRKIAKRAVALLKLEQDFAIAMITHKAGTSPRDVGTVMLIEKDGSGVGSVGGGTLEAAVKNRAIEVIRDKKSTVMQVDNLDIAKDGLACGCRMDVVVDYVDAKNPEYAKLYGGICALFDKGGQARFGLLTGADSAALCQCLFYPEGGVIGADETAIGTPAYSDKDFETLTCPGGTLYVVPVGAGPKAIVVGAGHVGSRVAPLLAFCGFDTVVLDDREGLLVPGRFPSEVRTGLLETFKRGVFDAEPCDEDTYVVIATKGHEFDRSVLEQALGTKARYIGMMGSRAKRDRAFEYLLDRGFTKDDFARVHAPIGLALKAQTPEEIAVSIVGEMILCRHSE